MATLKQKRLASIISENIRIRGNKTMGKMMVEAGYSSTTSKKPKLATNSKGFQRIISGTKTSENVRKTPPNKSWTENPYVQDYLP